MPLFCVFSIWQQSLNLVRTYFQLLCTQVRKLQARRKIVQVVVVAIARELVAFMLAIARQIAVLA